MPRPSKPKPLPRSKLKIPHNGTIATPPPPQDGILDARSRVIPTRGWVDPKALPIGPNGHALCRYCAHEVKPPKRTFCSALCVHEWKIRTQPQYARKELFQRDKGVCRQCRVDTNRLRLDLLALRRTSLVKWRLKREKLKQQGIPMHRRWLFDVDHVVPVQHGGGCSGLDNLQTLCIPCHLKKTKKQLKQGAKERRRLKAKEPKAKLKKVPKPKPKPKRKSTLKTARPK